MTAQVSDTTIFQGEAWAIAALQGGPLFEPRDFGLEPVGASTACWHGYCCEYEVAAQSLTLKNLEIGVAPENEPLLVALNGHRPKKSRHGACGDWNYRGIALPISFSGGLVLCRDFIEELYVHMGFHPAWKYRRVHELVLRDGIVLESQDRSAKIAEIRAQFLAAGWSADPFSDETKGDLVGWIEKCFSLDYGKSGLD